MKELCEYCRSDFYSKGGMYKFCKTCNHEVIVV